MQNVLAHRVMHLLALLAPAGVMTRTLLHILEALIFQQFAFWIGMAVWHSILLYFFSYGFLYDDIVWKHGRAAGWLMLGNSCYTVSYFP